MYQSAALKNSLQQQIRINGGTFGDKCCRCKDGLLYHEHKYGVRWVSNQGCPRSSTVDSRYFEFQGTH